MQWLFPTEVVGPYFSASSSSSNTVVGDITLKQQFTDSVMGYASYSRRLLARPPINTFRRAVQQRASDAGRQGVDQQLRKSAPKGTYLDRRLTLKR